MLGAVFPTAVDRPVLCAAGMHPRAAGQPAGRGVRMPGDVRQGGVDGAQRDCAGRGAHRPALATQKDAGKQRIVNAHGRRPFAQGLLRRLFCTKAANHTSTCKKEPHLRFFLITIGQIQQRSTQHIVDLPSHYLSIFAAFISSSEMKAANPVV